MASTQFHVHLDDDVHADLDWLREALEASSSTEVMRRALQEFWARGGETPEVGPANGLRSGFFKISPPTAELLDRLAERHGASYRQVATAAIRAFVPPVRETLALRDAGNPDNLPPPVF